jgi:hypothetical protein
VRWDYPESDPSDSGFSCWSNEDNFDGLSDQQIEARLTTECLHCLIEEHPEAGALLDRASEAPDHLALCDD